MESCNKIGKWFQLLQKKKHTAKMRKLKEIVIYFLHPVLSLMYCERANTSSN